MLARAMYIDEQVQNGSNIDTLSPGDMKRLIGRYNSTWGNLVKQGHHIQELKEYNQKAKNLLLPFLGLTNVHIAQSSEDVIYEAMDIAIHTPLHSSDAVIVAVAKKLEVKGLLV